jgi:hypothetical protein
VGRVTYSVAQTDVFVLHLNKDEAIRLLDNLGSRSISLRLFERMPPPLSQDDVSKLEGLIADYKTLVQSLFELRKAVDVARRKLAS